MFMRFSHTISIRKFVLFLFKKMFQLINIICFCFLEPVSLEICHSEHLNIHIHMSISLLCNLQFIHLLAIALRSLSLALSLIHLHTVNNVLSFVGYCFIGQIQVYLQNTKEREIFQALNSLLQKCCTMDHRRR